MFLTSRADNVNASIVPLPHVLAPSGRWDGNDGKWSTFVINIGDVKGEGNGQDFRVLISTSSPVTQVPRQADWCDDAECAARRGIEAFQGRQSLGLQMDPSNGWNQNGMFNFLTPHWWSDRKINSTYGNTAVGLGPSSGQNSSVLPGQVVVANDAEEFFMGSFGLETVAVNTGGGPQASFLESFVQNQLIPSRSYGYTAGASYRNDGRGTPGNLVLGGFDQTRMAEGVSIAMGGDHNHTLVVGVQSVEYHSDRDVEPEDISFTYDRPGGFLATIDSTLPYLWLPDYLCDQFADTFRLTYDNSTNMYTVDASAHDYNTRQNATVTFKIGQEGRPTNDARSIALPYAAFDLEASQPIFSDTTRYFPIKKSPNGMYVLGRAFLQETYIVVDFERNNFTVSPALFPDPTETPHVVSIYNTTYTPPQSTEPSAAPGTDGGGMNGGTIAGVVVGVVVGLGILAFAAFLYWRRRRKQQRKLNEKLNPQDIDTTQAGRQVQHRRVSELDSEPPNSPKPSTLGYYGNDGKDIIPFPPISEMESPPAELYSPPPDSIAGLSSGTPQSEQTAGTDYFINGAKIRRRGATRDSSTCRDTPQLAELPGDERHREILPNAIQSVTHHRGPSDASLPSNIDAVITGTQPEAEQPKTVAGKIEDTAVHTRDAENGEEETKDSHPPLERKSSHARGLSDTTVQSDSTAISQPTPEELDRWARDGSRRPVSE